MIRNTVARASRPWTTRKMRVPRAILFTIYYSRFSVFKKLLTGATECKKHSRLEGKKLLIVRPINLDGSDTSGYVVAVDTVGAGFHERVLVVAGSSARLAQNMKDTPVDAAVVGVIDTVDIMAPE